MTDSGFDACACSHSACASSAHDDPPWDSHDCDGFWSLRTYNQLVEAHDSQFYAFWCFLDDLA